MYEAKYKLYEYTLNTLTGVIGEYDSYWEAAYHALKYQIVHPDKEIRAYVRDAFSSKFLRDRSFTY